MFKRTYKKLLIAVIVLSCLNVSALENYKSFQGLNSGKEQVALGKLILPAIFTDHMVLQQETDVVFWGKSAPGEEVYINTGWDQHTYQTKAKETGDWEIKVRTPSYGGPYMVNVSVPGGEALTLKDVLIGEVWLCSGQSNMEMPPAGWGKIINYEQEIAAANYPEIRLLQAEHVTSDFPLNDAKFNNGGSWQPCTPESVAEFSSVAYFFAREIYKKTNIPIGLIHTSWGGTVAEAWTSGSSLKKMPDFMEKVQKIEQYKRDENELPYSEKLKIWLKNTLAADKGYENNTAIWAGKELDLSGWGDIALPGLWENSALPDFDGIVWFRKSIIIPPALAGKDLKLTLGTIDDNDVTFFNGEKVGEKQGYNLSRTYIIPGNLVKSGENTITVRVFDSSGGGGIYGEQHILALKSETGEKISLDGIWKYKTGLNLKDFTPMPVEINGPNRPTVLYNAMIHPFIKYVIKGVIWYQGEANTDRPAQYRELFPLLINDWREKWNIGDFPFYFVQLASFMEKDKEPASSSAWAELRDAQLQTLTLPNTGMAVSIDIGDAKDIHPKNKQEVGRRLALIALNRNYKKKLTYSGPLFRSYKIRKDQMILSFDHGKGLRTRDNVELKGFAISGPDHKFQWAKAIIKDGKVIINSAGLTNPTAIRYSWGNNPDGNLYNNSGLPASPFQLSLAGLKD